MVVAVNYADRMALIASIAEKHKAKAILVEKTRTNPAVATRPQKAKSFLDQHSQEDGENINRYTDEAKYAKAYYGDVFYETTRFDHGDI